MCFFPHSFHSIRVSPQNPKRKSDIMTCPGYWTGNLLLSHFQIHCTEPGCWSADRLHTRTMDFGVHFKFHSLIRIRPCIPMSRPKQGYTHSVAPHTTVSVASLTAFLLLTITHQRTPHPRSLSSNWCSWTLLSHLHLAVFLFSWHIHLMCPLSSLCC